MQFKFAEAALAALLAFGLPAAATAASFTGLGEPASEGAGTNDDEYGWSFTATADLLVTELGFYASSAGTTTLNLWSVLGQTNLASVSATADDTGWTWVSLASAVALDAGASYTVSWGGGDLGGSYATAPNYVTSPYTSYVAAQVGDTVGDYPVTQIANGAVFLADIGFELAPVPVPAAAPLAIAGLAALGFVARRRRG